MKVIFKELSKEESLDDSISNLRRKRKTGWILDIRELLSSLSMWNSDRYDKEICTKLFQEFRYYDKVLRQVKSIG
ncbi:hypothetical protein N9D55_01225 [Flavobacteriaceae bacterium]|nr:hypothetical protein [Flavobacteriaceae bacterium]